MLRANGGKGLSQNDYSNTEKAKVASKIDSAKAMSIAAVKSVNGMTGTVVLTKAHVGLGNVPNTDATNPANILWNQNYRTVTDNQVNTWNSYGTGKPNIAGDNTFGGKTLLLDTSQRRHHPVCQG